jgi:hypothetical protein
VPQVARFVADPKVLHGKAVKWIGHYLKGTCDKGLIYDPYPQLGFDVYVDASFARKLDLTNVHWDRDTARSRAACPIICTSKLQSEVALSTTESDYIAMSTATREVLTVMELTQLQLCIVTYLKKVVIKQPST